MKHTRRYGYLAALVLTLGVLAACGGTAQTSPDAAPAAEESADEGAAGEGTLQFRANGEDFVRQGFTTSDGWAISFDHVYVTLADVTAYQSDPPYDAEEGGTPQAEAVASLDEVHTVDLAAGDENADPILIGETMAPAGRYNALSWEMRQATDGPASGAVIMMQGTATKDGETVDFTIRLDKESTNTCGDFVGDERKGILEAGETADLEATFHFDHIFGDGDAPPDDSINTGSVGFAPFAALADNGTLDVDMAALEAGLPADAYDKLTTAHLTHVGEGHCNTSS